MPNVTALEAVQPKDLTAAEISVRLGATWLPPEVLQGFIFDFLDTPRYSQWDIKVHYSALTADWNIEGKSKDKGNVKAYSTYGTSRINAYKIIEETLNLRDVRIFDYVGNENGNKIPVLNKKETAIAQQKQEIIKSEFGEWIWKDPDRREKLTRLYNDKFINIRPREYDGSHLTFDGMSPEITLRPHQSNAIARVLYGGNTLLAHVVGAGKSATRVSAAGDTSTGTMRPFGLDCSGFVTWAFINAGISGVGDGTYAQNANSIAVSWNNAQPGDLAFYGDLSHIGIVVGKDINGNILVVHCNSGSNNVSITTNGGFGFAARPNVLR